MAKWMHIDRLQALAVKALGMGAVMSAMNTVEWDIAGDCQSPHCTEKRARPDAYGVGVPDIHRLEKDDELAMWVDNPLDAWQPVKRLGNLRNVKGGSLWMHLWTRCRKCPACRKQRARLWRARCRSELGQAPRSWFVTYTFNEVHRYNARLLARKLLLDRSGEHFEELTSNEQFMLLHEVVARELTLMIKRLRKNAKAPLRYMLVAEAHKDGFPHYHGVIHELNPGTLTERDIRAEWRGRGLGFCEAKLVYDAAKGSAYLCKYLTKSSLARVRASQNYGQSFAHRHLDAYEAVAKFERTWKLLAPPKNTPTNERQRSPHFVKNGDCNPAQQDCSVSFIGTEQEKELLGGSTVSISQVGVTGSLSKAGARRPAQSTGSTAACPWP